MSIDLTGIHNQNEYYTNHYFATIFEENEKDTLSKWREEAKDSEIRTPWSMLRDAARQYGVAHERYLRSNFDMTTLQNIRSLADIYLRDLGYPEADPQNVPIDEETIVPVYLELRKNNGAPLLWVLLASSADQDANVLERYSFDGGQLDSIESQSVPQNLLSTISNEDLATKILFTLDEPPRFLIFIGMNQIAMIDRNKWNEKRYLQFNLDEIFGRREETTLKAMAVLLHKDSLCPEEGKVLLDEFDENSQRNASGVSQDLKYALRESIELLGNEVLYDQQTRQGRNLETDPIDAGELTLECLRYMYRMLFVLFIESRQDLGYAPMKSQVYFSAYSLESLRDIAEQARDDINEIGDGYYLFESLEQLYDLIYSGYPKTEEAQQAYDNLESHHDDFRIPPLKAHIFDPERTRLITNSKIRNHVMLRIIDLMSVTRGNGKKGGRGRISYSNLGINQMGAVYEALLSYRGFIAEQDLYEVKPAGSKFDELEVGYFIPESDLDQYTEDERVYITDSDNHKRLRMYKKGTFIYRLAGREREKSASYYTPEVLTKCLVKYALKELLKDKSADDILNLNICEPAMGSAAFLNEAINQLSEAYIDKKQKEIGENIPYNKRQQELQKVKMYIADRNVYGIDLNPVAVELAEVSLWLNTIYEGSFVPWFGTQLVNGNSLIGARRECYSVPQLKTSSKGMRWYESAPERVPLGTTRKPRTQVYHFLLGDPGMSSYNDKVIKQLEPENIKKINAWRKEFTKPYDDNDIKSLLNLSKSIDDLWERQVELRKEVDAKTQDRLSVYGHEDTKEDSHTTIREKDRIFSEVYKSEHMKNAGPYARLKFAMDYWCALWFWPIDQADLLPSRSEFIFEMDLILNGTTNTDSTSNNAGIFGQLEMFPTSNDKALQDFIDMSKVKGEVDIPALCAGSPRLALVRQIAEQNHFMHWELEFADLFAEKGGFDLIIGNPPWIKIEWNEQGVLSDSHPMFSVKKLTANEITYHRENVLKNTETKRTYFFEFESTSGTQAFLNAAQNYIDLKGQQTNLYKCFLPQAWNYGARKGISAFIHPEGVYDDPKGGALREKLYTRLRIHFQFANELKLFSEVDHHTTFSLNVYSYPQIPSFESISNLYVVKSITECYEGDNKNPVPEIKDENGNWNTKGHPDRIVHITKSELATFAKIFDGTDDWKRAKLPVLHVRQLVEALGLFEKCNITLSNIQNEVFSAEMWHETNNQVDGTIERNVHFPDDIGTLIYSGPHIGVSNPLFKTSRRVCKLNSDYDNIDLTNINSIYMPRCNYSIACSQTEYSDRVPTTQWGNKYDDDYRLCLRKMLNQGGERTLIGAIIPPKSEHINGIFGLNMGKNLASFAANVCSVPYDFFIKTTGKANINFSAISGLPILSSWKYQNMAVCRAMLLNCVTRYYAPLWEREYKSDFSNDHWMKIDTRLNNSHFSSLTSVWDFTVPLKSDYERRQALVELDVLTALALGMNLKQLITIYRIQFPVLKAYEADTWYDANGRIVFTNNRSLTGVGFTRTEWENGIKGAPAGKKFYRTITDDTLPGGPVERTIEYVAPFDRCDREKDYETAWKFFEEKYGGEK